MNIYIAVFFVAGVVSLVGYLWLAMVAFKRSVAWGLLVLLLSPITAIVYSLMHWFEARLAFLIYIISFVLCTGAAVFIYGDVGMGNMHQIVTRMHSGELAPAKAYTLIVKGLAHPGSTDLFALETTGNPSGAQTSPDPAFPVPVESTAELVKAQQATPADAGSKAKAESAKPQVKPTSDKAVTVAVAEQNVKGNEASKKPAADVQTQKSQPANPKTGKTAAEKSKKEEKKAKPQTRIPNINQVPPDPLAQKPLKPEPNTVRVSMARMPHYIGHYFIVKLKNGSEQRGLLRKVTKYNIILDRLLYGGNFQFTIRKSHVKSIHMLTRLPDER